MPGSLALAQVVQERGEALLAHDLDGQQRHLHQRQVGQSLAQVRQVHVLDRPGVGPVLHARRPGNGGPPDYECAAKAQLQRAVPLAAREFCRVEEVVAHGKAAPAILRQAAERGVGLVVMGVHGRSMLDLMAFGSVTHEVVRQAECPVLTVRHRSG